MNNNKKKLCDKKTHESDYIKSVSVHHGGVRFCDNALYIIIFNDVELCLLGVTVSEVTHLLLLW